MAVFSAHQAAGDPVRGQRGRLALLHPIVNRPTHLRVRAAVMKHHGEALALGLVPAGVPKVSGEDVELARLSREHALAARRIVPRASASTSLSLRSRGGGSVIECDPVMIRMVLFIETFAIAIQTVRPFHVLASIS